MIGNIIRHQVWDQSRSRSRSDVCNEAAGARGACNNKQRLVKMITSSPKLTSHSSSWETNFLDRKKLSAGAARAPARFPPLAVVAWMGRSLVFPQIVSFSKQRAKTYSNSYLNRPWYLLLCGEAVKVCVQQDLILFLFNIAYQQMVTMAIKSSHSLTDTNKNSVPASQKWDNLNTWIFQLVCM